MSKKSEQYESQDEYDSSYESEDEFKVKITTREGVKDLCLAKAEEKRNKLLMNMEEDEEEEEDESETEDEDGELAGKVADSFLDILPKIASRHPDIYKPDAKFFPDEIEDDSSPKKEKKEKALTYKDLVRNEIVSKMDVEDDNSDSEEELPPPPPPKKKSYDEELRDLKNEFLKAADGLVNDGDEEDDILNKVERTEEEKEEFENEYKEFLKQQELKAKDDETLKTLSQFWLKDDELDENEKFLRDYIINKRWIIRDKGKDNYYNVEIDDEDEEALNNQDDFESVYNFRYEEPDGDKIIQYARQQTDSVRRKNNKRKEARQRRKERKRLENERKKAEKIALKKEKKKEIWNKLKELVASEGLEDEALKGIDFESDFDPQLFDQDLETLFGKNKKIAEEFEKYLEEYHQLDYEDIIGGMPVRFKYVKVKPCNYGLTAEQILTMDDKELNKIVPLKKLATYRDDEEDIKRWKKKNKQKKKKRKRDKMTQSNDNNNE